MTFQLTRITAFAKPFSFNNDKRMYWKLPVFLFLFTGSIHAQTYISAEFAPGFGGNTTSSFPIGGTAAVYGKIAFTIAENTRFITGIGYSGYSYSDEIGNSFSGSESLTYIEVPALIRFELFKQPKKNDKPIRHGAGMRKEVAKRNKRDNPFRPHAYVDLGLIAGILNHGYWDNGNNPVQQTRIAAGENTNQYTTVNLKPALGLGMIFGGPHKFCFTSGFMFSTALANQYQGNSSSYLNESIPLFAFTIHVGLQMRLGN